jgi:hypothetical protein
MSQDKDIKTLDQIKIEADPDIEIHSLRRQVDSLKSEIKKMQADYGDLKGYFRDLSSTAMGLAIEPQPQIYVPKKTKVSSPCFAVLHFTDWHYGALQVPEEIEFFNEFSPDILVARIKNFIQDYMNWINVQRTAYSIDVLKILVTGDMISGDIHRELSITNAFPTPVQAFNCGILLGETICSFVPHFKNVCVEFVVPDNHGRLTKKPQSKQEGLNTHNYVVGHVAKVICRNQENVEFNIHSSYVKAISVGNRNYLITHGHGIRGWAGFPYYGAERFVAKEALARLHEPDQNRFHKVVLGHFHAPLWHPRYWIGGSASGCDAFDRKQGRRAAPKQTGWLVHEKRAEFNMMEFLLRHE